jgi:hypothetical protein
MSLDAARAAANRAEEHSPNGVPECRWQAKAASSDAAANAGRHDVSLAASVGAKR